MKSSDTQPFPIEDYAWYPETMYSSVFERVTSIVFNKGKMKNPLIYCSFKNKHNGTIIYDGEKLWPHGMKDWEVGQLCGGN